MQKDLDTLRGRKQRTQNHPQMYTSSLSPIAEESGSPWVGGIGESQRHLFFYCKTQKPGSHLTSSKEKFSRSFLSFCLFSSAKSSIKQSMRFIKDRTKFVSDVGESSWRIRRKGLSNEWSQAPVHLQLLLIQTGTESMKRYSCDSHLWRETEVYIYTFSTVTTTHQ